MAILVDTRYGLRERALAAIDKLPPFSPILNKLLASLAGENVSFATLGDLIEKDTVVAGNLLNLVNSALYGRRSTISSVRHALSVLGLDKVRNAVLGMSISRMWNQARTPAGWSMARFNMHSASAGILSDQIAQHANVDFAEGAFVAGLLHDSGRLLIALGLPEEFARLMRTYERSEHSWMQCEEALLGFSHASLSAEILARWNLPEPIQIAARDHHKPAPFRPGDMIPLSRVVDAANQYVNSMGESILVHQKSDGAGSAWVASLGIQPEQLERLLSDFENERRAMAAFFR